MDAFTRRVELEDEDDSAQPPHLLASSGDVPVGNDDDITTPDDDQVVPGQEHHLDTATPRRQPFYEGIYVSPWLVTDRVSRQLGKTVGSVCPLV